MEEIPGQGYSANCTASKELAVVKTGEKFSTWKHIKTIIMIRACAVIYAYHSVDDNFF